MRRANLPDNGHLDEVVKIHFKRHPLHLWVLINRIYVSSSRSRAPSNHQKECYDQRERISELFADGIHKKGLVIHGICLIKYINCSTTIHMCLRGAVGGPLERRRGSRRIRRNNNGCGGTDQR